MNDDAVLYAKSNTYQRNAVKNVLDEFAPFLNWRKDGSDTVLAVGCGSGDVTAELILPILPSEFDCLIGCDLSDKMVQHAQQHYSRSKVAFEKLDIRDDVGDFLKKYGPFHHIVSFFCLHWVENKKEAISNIRKLLTPDGDCLLMFLISSNTIAVYDEMSKTQKWSKYMKDIELYIPPHQYVGNPIDDFQQICQSVGFAYSNVQIRESPYFYENYEEYKNLYRSISPFLKRVPVNEQEDFVNELTERLLVKYQEQKYDADCFVASAKTIVIHAKK